MSEEFFDCNDCGRHAESWYIAVEDENHYLCIICYLKQFLDFAHKNGFCPEGFDPNTISFPYKGTIQEDCNGGWAELSGLPKNK